MNDLVILHLSDLHIEASTTKYSPLLIKLLDDIKKEITYVPDNSVVVAVTGDIIHKGDKNAVKNAINFFRDLHKIIREKVVSICIVPGNHDKFRTKANEFLIPAYRNMGSDLKGKFDDTFYKTFWKYQEETYDNTNGSGYYELVETIYSIFGLDMCKEHKFIKDTFGVNIIEVFGRKYCFVMLNTAWSCVDDKDSRQLILGQFQVSEILRQYNNLSDKDDISLTLVLGHHPIGELFGKEEDNIFSEMISHYGLNANAYLCGHTHDRNVINWVNNWHSINTFMSGIGWPESNDRHNVGSHTYSMYIFNLDANAIDIYVRSTDDSGEFNPDFRIYTNNMEKFNKKIVFPIKAETTQTYISLGAGPDRTSKAYYISDEFMEYMKGYLLRIGRLRQSIGTIIEKDKLSFFDNFGSDEDEISDSSASDSLESNLSVSASSVSNETNTETDNKHNSKDEDNSDYLVSDYLLYNYLFADIDAEKQSENDETYKQTANSNNNDKKVEDILRENDELIYSMFLSFLRKICIKMEKILLFEQTEKDDIVRFHFRYLADKEKLVYTSLCTSFFGEVDSNKIRPSDISYGQLIEASYKTKNVLIYSVNKSFCTTELKSKWTNFLTAVPDIEGNDYKSRYADACYKQYPFITFGVTTNSQKFDRLLYCMDYFSINTILEEMINTYIKIFKISIDDFCEWVKNNHK